MSTMDNLIKAFEGESWAIRKYHAFAERAEQEGFEQAVLKEGNKQAVQGFEYIKNVGAVSPARQMAGGQTAFIMRLVWPARLAIQTGKRAL